ncbi:unnamed protein product [Ectocarpus sp. 4 AP-2014]
MSEHVDAVNEMVGQHGVVVYSKSYCPFCTKAKKALKDVGAKYELIELDQVDNGSAIQDALQSITGQRSVPNVFIGGTVGSGRNRVQREVVVRGSKAWVILFLSRCVKRGNLPRRTSPLFFCFASSTIVLCFLQKQKVPRRQKAKWAKQRAMIGESGGRHASHPQEWFILPQAPSQKKHVLPPRASDMCFR